MVDIATAPSFNVVTLVLTKHQHEPVSLHVKIAYGIIRSSALTGKRKLDQGSISTILQATKLKQTETGARDSLRSHDANELSRYT